MTRGPGSTSILVAWISPLRDAWQVDGASPLPLVPPIHSTRLPVPVRFGRVGVATAARVSGRTFQFPQNAGPESVGAPAERPSTADCLASLYTACSTGETPVPLLQLPGSPKFRYKHAQSLAGPEAATLRPCPVDLPSKSRQSGTSGPAGCLCVSSSLNGHGS
jgi:hypothetical protein